MHIPHDHVSGLPHDHEHEHTHSHEHTHADGTTHTHEHPHEHSHTHEHPHTHEELHALGIEHTHDHEHHHHEHDHDHHHHDHDCAHSCDSCGTPCEHTPMEELMALMQYMAGHNAAHARELADLAVQLDKNGNHIAYEQVMAAVSDFEKGNMRLSVVLSSLKA